MADPDDKTICFAQVIPFDQCDDVSAGKLLNGPNPAFNGQSAGLSGLAVVFHQSAVSQ